MYKRKLILGFLLILALGTRAHGGIHNVATINGTSSAVAIVAGSPDQAKWIQVIAPSGNSSTVRFGDSTTSATVGLPIVAGAGYNTPPCDSCVYPLSGTFIYVATGDTASVSWGN